MRQFDVLFIVRKAILFGWLFAIAGISTAFAQASAPKTSSSRSPSKGAAAARVTKIDDKQFAELLKPKGKPLMINFWATWCGPCREEFPDLVKLDAEFKGKIDFITVTLDFEEEISTGVPKFLSDMKASMPTYLLVTPDETAAIATVSKDWAGGLPFTVIYAPGGSLAFFHQGIVKPQAVRSELNKLLEATPSAK